MESEISSNLNISNNLTEYNLYHDLDKLINIIKSFNGCIFGEFIRDYYFNVCLLNKKTKKHYNLDNINNINIIFPNNSIIMNFIRILNQHYEIYKELNNDNINTYNLIYHYIEDNRRYYIILKLNILSNSSNNITNNHNINKLTYDIDCNLLAIETNSLYLINKNLSYYYCDYYKNSLSHFSKIFNRTLNKTFSLTKKSYNFDNYINNIDECYKLVKNNWIMDDYYNTNNNNISILFKWKNNNNKNYRLNYNDKDFKKLKSLDNCVICGNKFTFNCVVINTSCNHNFHWECGDKDVGLKYWILNHKNSCPICRQEKFI